MTSQDVAAPAPYQKAALYHLLQVPSLRMEEVEVVRLLEV